MGEYAAGRVPRPLVAPVLGAAQPPLRSGRLLLRRFEPGDAGEVRRLAGNRKVSATTLNIPHPYGAGVAERWIGSHVKRWRLRVSASWAVTLADPQTLAGAITLNWIDRSTAELGYWIGEPYWGRGYCSEAAIAVIEFAFAELGIELILAEHLRANPASGRVMQKAGMRHAGSARRRGRDGARVDMETYQIRAAPGCREPVSRLDR